LSWSAPTSTGGATITDYVVQYSTESTTYAIGDTGPGGGKIFYDAGSLQSWGRYLEAAPANWDGTNDSSDPEVIWGCPTNSIQTATAIGTGAANTSAIIAGCSGTTAASTARAYTGGGKTDWYLPSKDELEQMEVQRSILGFGGSWWHWSSSQYSTTEAHSRWLGTTPNDLLFGVKTYTDQVRPIRAIPGSFTTFSDGTSTTTTATVTGLTNGTVYYFKVAAVNSAGTSAYSAVSSGVTTLSTRTLTIDSASYLSSYRMAVAPPTIASNASAGTGTKTYSSSTTSVCTINSSSGLVAFVSVGTCTIGASIAADSSYNTATASTVSFSVVYAVGDTGPAGGTIFIIPTTTGNSTGKYFEAALGTWSNGFDKNNRWCNLTSTAIGSSAQGTAIGTGQANTTAIVAVCSSGAANDADTYSVTYSGNTYSDWFLPSQAELYQGWVQRAYLNPQTLTQLYGGSGTTSSYWSSSEYSATWAIPVAANGGGDNYGKIYGFNVRPVRMFSPSS